MVKYFIFLIIILSSENLLAQDSLPSVIDTGNTIKNTLPENIAQDSVMTDSLVSPVRNTIPKISNLLWQPDTFIYTGHTFFRFTDPIKYSITIKRWEGKEGIFYCIIALLLFFAFIKNGFYRYIQDMFRTFFRTTIKQRQIKDQIVQSPLPSLLLNIFFLLSIGMFLALLLQHYNLAMQFNFWILFAYCILGLTVIYGIKFLSLKLFGWVFQVSDAINTYIFIVFTTNKIIGIILLPFLVVMAFTYGLFNQAALTLSIMVVLGLIGYRFFLSYISIRRQLSISFFHFLIYLCAFEIVPLLLINKLLFRFLA